MSSGVPPSPPVTTTTSASEAWARTNAATRSSSSGSAAIRATSSPSASSRPASQEPFELATSPETSSFPIVTIEAVAIRRVCRNGSARLSRVPSSARPTAPGGSLRVQRLKFGEDCSGERALLCRAKRDLDEPRCFVVGGFARWVIVRRDECILGHRRPLRKLALCPRHRLLLGGVSPVPQSVEPSAHRQDHVLFAGRAWQKRPAAPSSAQDNPAQRQRTRRAKWFR